eukprot:1136691-Pelagomonas_calceolata.AAC.2
MHCIQWGPTYWLELHHSPTTGESGSKDVTHHCRHISKSGTHSADCSCGTERVNHQSWRSDTEAPLSRTTHLEGAEIAQLLLWHCVEHIDVSRTDGTSSLAGASRPEARNWEEGMHNSVDGTRPEEVEAARCTS